MLNEGRIAEYDSPHILLQGNGYFSKLVAELSIEESKNLHLQAEYYYNNPEGGKRINEDFVENIDTQEDISFNDYRGKVRKMSHIILCLLY